MSMFAKAECLRAAGASFLQHLLLPLLVLLVPLVSGCSPHAAPAHRIPVHAVELTGEDGGLYNMEFTVKDTRTSCMLAVKKTGSSVRASAVTWFGMSLFDVVVSEGGMQVMSCADFLERKPLLRLLENNLRCIFTDSGRIVREGEDFWTSRSSGLVCTRHGFPDGSLRKVSVRHRLSGICMELTAADR